MTSEERKELAKLKKEFGKMGPVDEIAPWRYGLNLTATRRLVVLLLKQIVELQGDQIETLDDAFRQISHQVKTGSRAGWWDTMSLSTAKQLGDQLVEAGLWERHPEGHGRRWFYRPIREAETTSGKDLSFCHDCGTVLEGDGECLECTREQMSETETSGGTGR